jgi:hypothetical protein
VYQRLVGPGDRRAPSRATKARERSLVALAAVALQGVARRALAVPRRDVGALALVAPIALMARVAAASPGTGPPGLLWLRRLALVGSFALAGVMVAR